MIPDFSQPAPFRARRGWIAFLALAPLAAATGFWMEYRARGELSELTIDRVQAIAAARQYLGSTGLDVSGWQSSSSAETNQPKLLYTSRRHTPEAALMNELSPWSAARVTFRPPAGGDSARVLISLDGRILGYETRPHSDGADPGDETALRAASAVRAADPVFSARLRTGPPEITNRKNDKRGVTTRTYTWHGGLEARREVDFRLVVTVENGRVVGRNVEAEVDPVLLSALENEGGQIASKVFGIAYGLFLAAVILYSLYRYVRRSFEKEISHRRSLLVAALTVLVIALQFYNVRDQFAAPASGVEIGVDMLVFLLVVLGVVALVAGGLVGMAYGAGEGDVREGNPGKLASLDALILGRVLSKNVGVAALVGAACAGWLFLLHGAVRLALPGGLWNDANELQVLFVRSPLVAFLAGQPLGAMIDVVSGLFQPLAFSRLNLRRPGARMAFLIACAVLASLLARGSGAGPAGTLAAMAIGGALLLAPFFLCDVLASMAAHVVFSSLVLLAFFLRLPGGFESIAAVLAALGAVTLAAFTWAALRGRYFREEQVRPYYASQIAERMALEAEVSAAREAQLRLLPERFPRIPGLSIAGSCVPAREVGGDFFDFFRLSPTELGIFVAEGQGRGLASAMTIALAKGYLMHAVGTAGSPMDVLLRLERALGALLHTQEARTNITYAVLDSATGRLRYARTGEYPRILALLRGRSIAPRLESTLALEGRPTPVVEGELELVPGASLMFYTDGIAKRLARISTLPHQEYLAKLDGDPRLPAEALHLALFHSLLPRGRKQGEELEDDLTAVVIRLARLEPGRMEVVA